MNSQLSVQVLDVPYRGQAHRTSYFVENGIIYAKIGDRTVLTPASIQSPEEIVRNLVIGKVEQQRRRLKLRSAWQKWQESHVVSR